MTVLPAPRRPSCCASECSATSMAAVSVTPRTDEDGAMYIHSVTLHSALRTCLLSTSVSPILCKAPGSHGEVSQAPASLRGRQNKDAEPAQSPPLWEVAGPRGLWTSLSWLFSKESCRTNESWTRAAHPCAGRSSVSQIKTAPQGRRTPFCKVS